MGFGVVEEECTNGLENVLPQFIPVVGLCEDILGQTLGAKTAVSLLDHLED